MGGYSSRDFKWENLGTRAASSLLVEGDTAPRSYLAFAADDLAEPDSPRSRINALSNARRAILLQLVRLTDALGYEHWLDDGPNDFSRRMRFSTSCGAITPRIVSKINALRGRVEHRRKIPDRSVVSDYVSVAELYLAASDTLVTRCPYDQELCFVEDSGERRKFTLSLQRNAGVMRLYACDIGALVAARPNAHVKSSQIAPDQDIPKALAPAQIIVLAEDAPSYFDWMRLLLVAPYTRRSQG